MSPFLYPKAGLAGGIKDSAEDYVYPDRVSNACQFIAVSEVGPLIAKVVHDNNSSTEAGAEV